MLNYRGLKYRIGRHITNIQGWRTNRKIIVIESDDWGSIRMPSKKVYDKLLNAGIRVDKCPYNRNDSLATEEDLSALFDVLSRIRDKNGNNPVITANAVVANPDFERIKASDYQNYFFEPFTHTLRKQPTHQNAFNLWKQGINAGLFLPQFHGREHVNVRLWLNLLRANNPVLNKAFDFGFWGLGPSIANTGNLNIQATFDALEKAELDPQKKAINEGLDLFESLFDYRSKSFIANNFIWHPDLNPVLANKGVTIFQGMKYQKLPILNGPKRRMVRHYLGERNKLKQLFLIRNCTFEPTQHREIDSVSACFNDIKNAFFWKKPAIITTHRLNFIGFINPSNRKKNLLSFNVLFNKILQTWPEVEFMSSDILGETIASDLVCAKKQ